MKKSLFLIDGTALLYRAYYAFIKNPLINSKGQNTSAIFGVLSSFLSLVKKQNPDHIMISFDRKAPTFRHERSETYKANRPPMPDDLISQVEPVREFFDLIGLPEIGLDGYEADDILGTLARRFADQYKVVIVSGDKDFSQMVDGNILLYDPMKDLWIDRDAVYDRYGVHPEQFIDYLALIGDSSDNIPGVKGIGAKGAEALLKQYGTLDGIYANLDQITGKTKEKLLNDKENAYLSQELATIICSAPIPIPDPDAFRFQLENLTAIRSFLQEFEIFSLLKEIDARLKANRTEPESDLVQDDIFGSETESEVSEPEQETRPDGSLEPQAGLPFKPILATKENFPILIKAISNAEIISLDTETDNQEPMLANLVGISICIESSQAWYIPLSHIHAENLDSSEVLSTLSGVFASKLPTADARTLIGHNLKYDLIVLQRAGLQLDSGQFALSLFDTMIAAYLLDPGVNNYSLDECSLRELSHRMIPISELIGKGKNQITFDLVELETACLYASEDAWAAFMLYPIYRNRLLNSALDELFQEIELPLISVLKNMEMNGIAIDTHILSAISHQINIELKNLTERIYTIAGYTFNINSTQQLAKLLFTDLKIPTRKKTKTGQSTDISVLEELSGDYEIADLLIQYRQLSKLESTYVSALPRMLHPQTGRIHSSFNQTITSTGRLSSSNPNLQNIPIRTSLGREIRKAFVTDDDAWLYVSADYSQIELRLLALLSGDRVLLDAFKADLDIHKRTAAQIYNKDISQVTSEQRRQAKVINFGILYGMGQQKLSRELGITLAQAKDIITNYFAQFPGIRNFLNTCVDLARQNRFCNTLFGRRLYLPNINSSNSRLKSEAERIAVNMPIQGTAADLIKIAMRNIHQRIAGNPDIKMILQVHDELIFEVKKTYLEPAIELIRLEMENALPAAVRDKIHLKTDIGYGSNWFEAH